MFLIAPSLFGIKKGPIIVGLVEASLQLILWHGVLYSHSPTMPFGHGNLTFHQIFNKIYNDSQYYSV